jgi:glycosyltransferase involved in cell wall biosynthesis
VTRTAGSGPSFSVVIPAFNSARTIESAVRSALGQTERQLEVVVVDDGCTDATVDVVDRLTDPRVRVISQPNRGLPAARNAGITAARGTYVAFLDSDDLLLPAFLERAHQALEQTPAPGFAYTDAYVFDDRTGRVRERSAMARTNPPTPPPEDPGEFLAALMRSNFVYVSTVVPRAVLDHVGGFDETRTSCEDYELWLRILLAGYRVAWVPGRQALYRKHPGQMSHDLSAMTRNLVDVYEMIPPDAMPTPSHRKLLRERRRSANRQLRYFVPVAKLAPMHVITELKRLGVSESWYETPPAEVREPFPDLSAV